MSRSSSGCVSSARRGDQRRCPRATGDRGSLGRQFMGFDAAEGRTSAGSTDQLNKTKPGQVEGDGSTVPVISSESMLIWLNQAREHALRNISELRLLFQKTLVSDFTLFWPESRRAGHRHGAEERSSSGACTPSMICDRPLPVPRHPRTTHRRSTTERSWFSQSRRTRCCEGRAARSRPLVPQRVGDVSSPFP